MKIDDPAMMKPINVPKQALMCVTGNTKELAEMTLLARFFPAIIECWGRGYRQCNKHETLSLK